MNIKIFLLFVSAFLMSCSTDIDERASSSEASTNYKKITYHNDYQIGAYISSSLGFDSKSYWIEGPQGVVLIDTQFLTSAANEVVDIAESVTGKKVVMAIVLHANADKYNGTAALQDRGIKVVSSRQVVELIAENYKKNRELFYADYKDDYPEFLVLPEIVWDKTQEFDAVGLRFKAYVIRDGVSNAHLLIGLDHHLFTGDLVMNKYHARLELGKSEQWLDRLEEIRKFVHPKVIHPGRGYAMDGETLLSQQEKYLHDVRKVIAGFYTGGEITEQDQKDITKVMAEKYPAYGLVQFLESGIAAEWERMRTKDHEMM